MDFNGLYEGSRFSSFVEMIDNYLYLADRAGASKYTTVNAIKDIWTGRMKDWGWDVNEFSSLVTTFIE